MGIYGPSTKNPGNLGGWYYYIGYNPWISAVDSATSCNVENEPSTKFKVPLDGKQSLNNCVLYLFSHPGDSGMTFSRPIMLMPVARVQGGRQEPIDDQWDAVRSEIVFDPQQFKADALTGLDAFSHIEVVFHFDRVADEEIQSGTRHPRGRKDWPAVGIFAQRGKGRPNRIGICVCRLERIEGLALHVQGLDAIDGTPVLDVKPVMKGFVPRGEIREPAWAAEIMKDYW